MFKVGDKVRRTRGCGFGPNRHAAGFVGVVAQILSGEGLDVLEFTDGSSGYADMYEMVQPAGPVRTETVTKRRIVPGVYGRLEVGERIEDKVPLRIVEDSTPWTGVLLHLNATELDDLALVASQLAEALRDGQ